MNVWVDLYDGGHEEKCSRDISKGGHPNNNP
jgi:hypothetical protein